MSVRGPGARGALVAGARDGGSVSTVDFTALSDSVEPPQPRVEPTTGASAVQHGQPPLRSFFRCLIAAQAAAVTRLRRTAAQHLASTTVEPAEIRARAVRPVRNASHRSAASDVSAWTAAVRSGDQRVAHAHIDSGGALAVNSVTLMPPRPVDPSAALPDELAEVLMHRRGSLADIDPAVMLALEPQPSHGVAAALPPVPQATGAPSTDADSPAPWSRVLPGLTVEGLQRLTAVFDDVVAVHLTYKAWLIMLTSPWLHGNHHQDARGSTGKGDGSGSSSTSSSGGGVPAPGGEDGDGDTKARSLAALETVLRRNSDILVLAVRERLAALRAGMMDALFWHHQGDGGDDDEHAGRGGGGTGDTPAGTPCSVRVATVVRSAGMALAGMERWCVGKRLELECENEDVLTLLEDMYGRAHGNEALRRCLLEGGAGEVRDAASVCRWTLRNQAVGPRGKLRFKAALAAAVGLEDAMALLRLGYGDDDTYDPVSGLWTLGSRSVSALLSHHAWSGGAAPGAASPLHVAAAALPTRLSPIREVPSCASSDSLCTGRVGPMSCAAVQQQRQHVYRASGGIASRSLECGQVGTDAQPPPLPPLKRGEAHTTWTSPSRGPSTGTPSVPPTLAPAPSIVSPHGGALSPLADATHDGVALDTPTGSPIGTGRARGRRKATGVRAMARALMGRGDAPPGGTPRAATATHGDVAQLATQAQPPAPPAAVVSRQLDVPTAGVLLAPPAPAARRDSDADSVLVHESLEGVGRETSMFLASGRPLPAGIVEVVHVADTGCGPGRLCAGGMWKRTGGRPRTPPPPFTDTQQAQAAVAAAAVNAGVQAPRLDDATQPDAAAIAARARQDTANALARLQRDAAAGPPPTASASHTPERTPWGAWAPWRKRRASQALPPTDGEPPRSGGAAFGHARTASAPLPAAEAGVRLRSPTWGELATRRASTGDRVPTMRFESPAHEAAVRRAFTRAARAASPNPVEASLSRLERHAEVRDHTALAAANTTVAYQQRPAGGECAVM